MIAEICSKRRQIVHCVHKATARPNPDYVSLKIVVYIKNRILIAYINRNYFWILMKIDRCRIKQGCTTRTHWIYVYW